MTVLICDLPTTEKELSMPHVEKIIFIIIIVFQLMLNIKLFRIGSCLGGAYAVGADVVPVVVGQVRMI